MKTEFDHYVVFKGEGFKDTIVGGFICAETADLFIEARRSVWVSGTSYEAIAAADAVRLKLIAPQGPVSKRWNYLR